MTKKILAYKPTVINDEGDDACVTFLVHLKRCKSCKKLIMYRMNSLVFPFGEALSQKGQMDAAGILYQSDRAASIGLTICEACYEAGKTSFECAICNEIRSSDLYLKTVAGQPVCTVCYENMNARDWDETIADMSDSSYRYDEHD